MKLLNTKFWLSASGISLISYYTYRLLNSVGNYPLFWNKTLSSYEADMATQIYIQSVIFNLYSGIIILAIALLANEKHRARLGVVAMTCVFLFPLIISPSALNYYAPNSGFGLVGGPPFYFYIFLLGFLITLISCAVGLFNKKKTV
jgi:hypothetical protein